MTREFEAVVEEQLAKGLWIPVNPEYKNKWISQAFTVLMGQKEGLCLLVIHSQLSQYLVAPHFKMSSIKDVIALQESRASFVKQT